MTPIPTPAQEALRPAVDSRPLAGSNETSGRPYASWLLLLCIFAIIFRQTILLRQRATTVDFSAVDTYAALDIAIVFFTALVLLCSGSLGRTWSALRRTPAVWLYWYYLVCAVSFIWSAAPYYSLYRAGEYLVLLSATLAVVARCRDFIEAERAFLWVATVTLLLEMACTFRLIHYSFTTEDWHTNTYSTSSAILFCYCLGEYLAMSKVERSEGKARAKRFKLFGILSFCTLALGTSGASNVATVVGCMVIFLALRRLGLLLAGFFVGILLLLWGHSGEFFKHLLFPGKLEKNIETGTGRTIMWDYYWRRFLQSPIIGYGFGILSSGRDRAFAVLSHNSFFSVLIGTGMLGISMFGLFVARLWWITLGKVWRRGPGTVGFAGALAAAFVNGLGYPLMADRWITTSIVFVWLLGLFLIHIRTISPAKPIPGGATNLPS